MEMPDSRKRELKEEKFCTVTMNNRNPECLHTAEMFFQ